MKIIVMASLMLMVLAIGTKTDAANLLTCLRRPSSLLRIIAAMFVAVPLMAIALVKALDGPTVMKGAVLLMAISAAAPMLPKKLFKLGVDAAFAESLSAVTSVLAIPLVPLAALVLGAVFSRDVAISAGAVMSTLAMSFLIPLAVGMALKAMLGSRSDRVGEWAGTIGGIVLAVLVLLMLLVQRASVFPLLWNSLVLVALFAGGSLLIGHLLGGPDPRERTALAIASVTRHPGLAILIATTNAPQTGQAVPAILAVVIGCAIAAIPYTLWRKHSLTAQPGPPIGAPASAAR
jgi:bile acid:Na+ symporter, BASS family